MPGNGRHAASKEKRGAWLRRGQYHLNFKRLRTEESRTDFLHRVFTTMQNEGLYSETTYWVDGVGGIKKQLLALIHEER